ncbi:hypothetical protein AB0J82_06345 [Asanoa sp. NPDC049518]|uniref:hypothetical protein n=1 Tax=unclassified Asanoa TaxID=2685164 RepID=UPI00343B9110
MAANAAKAMARVAGAAKPNGPTKNKGATKTKTKNKTQAKAKAKGGKPHQRHKGASPWPPRQDIIDLVHAVRARSPQLAAGQIAALLRQKGIVGITEHGVNRALENEPRQRRPRMEAVGARGPREFAGDVRTLWAKDPWLTAKAMAARLRRRGWTQITEIDVQAALAVLNAPSNAVSRRDRKMKPGRIAALTGAPAQPAALVCPSCGVAVSQPGLCRCS